MADGPWRPLGRGGGYILIDGTSYVFRRDGFRSVVAAPAVIVAAGQAKRICSSPKRFVAKLASIVLFNMVSCKLGVGSWLAWAVVACICTLASKRAQLTLLCIRSSVTFTSRADANKQGWRDYRQWLATNQQQQQPKGPGPSAALHLQGASPAADAHHLSPVGLGRKRAAPGGCKAVRSALHGC
jgi:hypothetical protein